MLVEVGGRRLKFDLLGADGGPVLCLCHSLSSDSGVWSAQVAPLLGAGWRVLRLDMRGHGGSEAGAGGWTMAGLAGDVIGVLDALGLERVHFAGVSIGGMIGQQLGLDHPGRVQSLLLCGTSPQAVPGGQAMWDARFAAIRAAGSLAPLAAATMARWFTGDFRARCPDRWQQVHDTIAATAVAGYIAGAGAIIAFDVLDRLPEIRLPALVLCGDEDSGTPPAGNRLIAERIPGARYVEMPHARHIPMLEYPESFNRILFDWLGALSAGR
ncbi:MAG: alpha/beta fold hydrolase [Sphingomonadales bacterium]|nr:alpha/beta fold hydrolase [Sphingomonadales bacterium]